MSRERKEDFHQTQRSRIAAEVAERISAGSGARLELYSGRRVCPPKRLCCGDEDSCSVCLYCDDYFGCFDRFTGIFEGRITAGTRSHQR